MKKHNPLKTVLPQKYRPWVVTLALVVFFSYWVFVTRVVEQLNWATFPPALWQTYMSPLLNNAGIEAAFLRVAEFFSFSVLRHFIPLIVGYWLVHSTTLIMLQNLYDLPNKKMASKLLVRLQSSGVRLPVTITQDTLETDQGKGTLLSVGGPGRIKVRPENVVVTEMNGRKWQVLEAGVHKLLPFEQVKGVLDLRLQERNQQDISLLTKDGIPMSCHLGISFRIDQGSHVPTKKKPYPFIKQAVWKAAYAGTVFTTTPSEWSGIPLPIAIGQLEDVLLGFDLDDLIRPYNNINDRNSNNDPHLNVKTVLKERIQNMVYRFGIKIEDIRLGTFEISEAVTDQRIEFWRTKWEQSRQHETARGEATVTMMLEKAHNDAKMEMIQAIVDGIEQVKREHGSNYSHRLLAMRLLELMQGVAKRSSRVVNRENNVEQIASLLLNTEGIAPQDMIEQARAEMLADGR